MTKVNLEIEVIECRFTGRTELDKLSHVIT